MIFTYVHVRSYYDGPFLFDTIAGNPSRILLILPGVIAAPVVVLFNFYPRTIMRQLYLSSIRHELDRVKRQLYAKNLSQNERLRYVIDYDKLAQDELRHRLRTTLSDLPVLITLIMMVANIALR